jgi:hypothetical protein
VNELALTLWKLSVGKACGGRQVSVNVFYQRTDPEQAQLECHAWYPTDHRNDHLIVRKNLDVRDGEEVISAQRAIELALDDVRREMIDQYNKALEDGKHAKPNKRRKAKV